MSQYKKLLIALLVNNWQRLPFLQWFMIEETTIGISFYIHEKCLYLGWEKIRQKTRNEKRNLKHKLADYYYLIFLRGNNLIIVKPLNGVMRVGFNSTLKCAVSAGNDHPSSSQVGHDDGARQVSFSNLGCKEGDERSGNEGNELHKGRVSSERQKCVCSRETR